MIRLVIEIEEYGDIISAKEAVAQALEHFGSVRVVSVSVRQ